MLDQGFPDMNQDLQTLGGDMGGGLPVTAQSVPGSPLNGPEKAAVIIGLLGAESAGPIVAQIQERHLRRFMAALTNLKELPREIMLSAIAEFITQLEARKGGFRGGPDMVKDFVESLFDEEKAARLFGAPPPNSQPEGAIEVWAALKKEKMEDIVKYLSTQRAEVISVVLSQFDPGESGEILSELPSDLSIACVQQMSRGVTLEDSTLEAIAEIIRDEFLLADNTDNEKEAALFVSEVLGVLPRDRRDAMLALLEETDPQKAEIIRKAMLTFEDLTTRLPVTAIPIIFKDFAAEDLMKALKVGEEQNPEVVEYLFANISQRMAGQFKEEMGDLPALSQKEGDKAITALMSFIGKLEKDGRITLIKKQEPED